MLVTIQPLKSLVVEAAGGAHRSVYPESAEGTYIQIAATVRGSRSDEASPRTHALA